MSGRDGKVPDVGVLDVCFFVVYHVVDVCQSCSFVYKICNYALFFSVFRYFLSKHSDQKRNLKKRISCGSKLPGNYTPKTAFW